MSEAFICDAVRTPFGRYGGALSSMRTDDLGAVPLAELMRRNAGVDWAALDDVIYGCANQAGEDNRNVARMALLLAGFPVEVSAATVNRLCGSGMEAVGQLARAIRAGEAQIGIAGGVESMSRAPFVMPKADSAFSRANAVYDTTIGWRFVNPKMKAMHGVDQMPETAENVAADYKVSRADQDAFALRSQQRALAAQASGALAEEIVAVTIAAKKGDTTLVAKDEHPRETRRVTQRWSQRTSTRARRRSSNSQSSSPSSRNPEPSPPAMPRGSTTAAARSSSHPNRRRRRTASPRARASLAWPRQAWPRG